MAVLKVAPVFFLVLFVAAEKKIELQDIEDDNLQSEKQKEYESDPRYQNSASSATAASDYLKNSVYRYFEKPVPPAQQARMYSVTEAPEPPPVPSVHPSIQSKLEYTHTPQPQQAMVGYLSNVPMQIYLVPQYYNEVEQGAHAQNPLAAVQYTAGGGQYTAPQAPHGVARVAGYQTAPEAVQSQTNYVEVPAYVAPTAKAYVPQYSPAPAPVAYLSYAAPTAAPLPTVAPVGPVLTYQVQYPTPVIAPQPAPKGYYQTTHYEDTNTVDEHVESVDESPKYTAPEVSYSKAPTSDYPRYYSARPPPREEYHRHNQIQELPHPNPLLLKPHPPHLSHIPKVLPMYKPLNKPVYGGHPPGILVARPSEHFNTFKRRPTSLLDSYVPSRLQIEYMKRGFTNDPLQAYEDLAGGHHFSHAPVPRHFERGFLPNQMYHTASGGVTFGHYKRSSNIDKHKKN